MKNQPNAIDSTIGYFKSIIVKLMWMTIFFYFGAFGIEFYSGASESVKGHFQDAGTLTLGALLGILKETDDIKKAKKRDDEENEVKDHYEDENIDWSKGA